jgi:hypothetical protein
MLKSTRVRIECLTEMDIILFLEQSIRGGVSFINQRHCVANVENTSGSEEKNLGDSTMLYVSKFISRKKKLV